MAKHLATLALLAVSALSAAPVWLTGTGKTYHRNRDCSALARSANVRQADEKTALEHGLRLCGICLRRQTAKPKANTAWSTPEVKR